MEEVLGVQTLVRMFNELCLKHPPDVITIHTYFTRVDDDD